MGGGGPLLFIVYLAKRWASILQSSCVKDLGGGGGGGGATAWVGCRVDGEWEGNGLESGLGMGCGVCG